ncbi:hypothetical protein BT67DRAFT_149451 [Trichocladium antarcticum]|uniref:Uncharacterized protein n=1 Tax=Trichocladium antarcticum TaxID=1450529 RepID=A0AAN6UFG3_9PEZI|nr:hypothetical protein BT67DRAFT_149451 [Trichocladium antarcticum]
MGLACHGMAASLPCPTRLASCCCWQRLQGKNRRREMRHPGRWVVDHMPCCRCIKRKGAAVLSSAGPTDDGRVAAVKEKQEITESTRRSASLFLWGGGGPDIARRVVGACMLWTCGPTAVIVGLTRCCGAWRLETAIGTAIVLKQLVHTCGVEMVIRNMVSSATMAGNRHHVFGPAWSRKSVQVVTAH